MQSMIIMTSSSTKHPTATQVFRSYTHNVGKFPLGKQILLSGEKTAGLSTNNAYSVYRQTNKTSS